MLMGTLQMLSRYRTQNLSPRPPKRAVRQNSVSNASRSISASHLHVIERLSKEWTAPIYAFFHATPIVKCISGCRVHGFQCLAKHCRVKNGREVRHYLNTSDRKSTGNLRKHAKLCWGEDEVEAADQTKDVVAARGAINISKLKDGSLMAAFERV